MLRICLDSVRKYRSKSEFRNVNRVRLDDLEVVGDGTIIERIADKAIENGYNPQSLVEVYRGDTRVFVPITLERWSQGRPSLKEPSYAIQKAHEALRRKRQNDNL